jgi:hypothetical protein
MITSMTQGNAMCPRSSARPSPMLVFCFARARKPAKCLDQDTLGGHDFADHS